MKDGRSTRTKLTLPSPLAQTPELIVKAASRGAQRVLAGEGRALRHLSPAQRLVFSFGGIILLGTVLLALPAATVDRAGVPLLDALFISTSAVCVTGLSTIDCGAQLSFFGQAVLLGLIQVGALGFITLATGVVMGLGGRMSMLNQATVRDSYVAGGKPLDRVLWTGLRMTLLCEGIGTFLLTLRFKGIADYDWGEAAWAGLFHAVSAYANAGFSIFSRAPGHGGFESLTAFAADPVVNVTVTALIVCGGLGFLVFDDLNDWYFRPGHRLSLHSKIVLFTSAVLIAGGALLFFAFECTRAPFTQHGLGTLGWGSLFHSVSARTAGFNTFNLADAAGPTLLLLIGLMFIGGSPASCAGGVKTTTAFIMARLALSRLLNLRSPVAFGRSITDELVVRAATLTFFGIFFVGLIFTVVLVAEGDGRTPCSHAGVFLDLLFETVSAFTTTGLSTGVTASLSPVSKLALIAAMFIGRLGPLSIFVTLTTQASRDRVRYPSEPVLVG